MQTRSTKSSSKRATPVSVPSRHNVRWTASEEREMVRLRRIEGMNFTEIAKRLHRLPEAVNLRFDKLVKQHIEEGTDEKEVNKWFDFNDVRS